MQFPYLEMANLVLRYSGQVVALFIVGVSEYCAVWLWTDWEKEVVRGIERNEEENKRRRKVLGDES